METLYFCDFSGGGLDPLPPSPSGSANGMHLKEGTCLKCSVIIGRKVGLDYNSWYACLSLIRDWQTLIAGRKSREEREREREREREKMAHESFVLAWFLRISKNNVWVSQSASDEDPKPKLIVRIGFCTAKSDIPQY